MISAARTAPTETMEQIKSAPSCSQDALDVFDTGLQTLSLVASYYRISADVNRLRHDLGLANSIAEIGDIIAAAEQLGLKARFTRRCLAKQIQNIPMPALVRLNDATWGVLLRPSPNRACILMQAHRDGPPTSTELDDNALRITLTGEVILLKRRMGGPGVSPSVYSFSWFVPTLRRYRKPLVQVLLGSVFVQLFALATPLLFQLVIDKVLVHKSLPTLTLVVIGMIAINVFDAILQYLRAYILGHTASRIDVELGARLFDRLTRLPLSYFETRAAGQIVARVRELETIRSFLTGQGLTSILDLAFSIIFFAVLYLYSPMLTMIVALSLPCYVLIACSIRPVLRRRIDERFQTGSACQQLLVESVIGVQTLKAAAVEPQLRNQWEERLASYVRSSFSAVATSAIGQSAIAFVSKMTLIFVLYFGAHAVINGDMTVGALVAFNMLMLQVTQPVLRLSQLWQDFQQVQVSVERLGDILNHPPETQPSVQPNLPPMRGAVNYRGIRFRYSKERTEVLSDFTLSIPEGQMIGIIGPSGSGKSTLTKLLQRFYKPEAGSVFVDGIDLAQADLTWLRRQIGVVQQEDTLFNCSIHDNIALANPAMSRGQVIEAAKLAGADEFITKLPGGYDTIIEERGANLSGGQRQRLAIARALAGRPRILILDEATSALDYESERLIKANLRRIAKGRTVIIIAHRLAAVEDCDRIVAMHSGKVIEDSTPRELMANPTSFFRKMWDMQNGRRAV